MTHPLNTNDDEQRAAQAERPSVLSTLRALLPTRPLQLFEALRIAELQANRLLDLSGSRGDLPVPSDIVTTLPRILVDYDAAMPVSGASDWDSTRRCWVITLNALEPETRQRFSLFHEYKHIIDHDAPGLLITGPRRTYFGLPPEEYLAEYFAGCALMPKRLVKRAWGDGIQRAADLAELCDVSERAMAVRLAQLNLTEPTPRCTGPMTTARRPHFRAKRGAYRRQLSRNWSRRKPAEAAT